MMRTFLPPPLLWKSGLRFLYRHPWLFALSVTGIALGVTIVVAIDLANNSAQRAFRLSSEAVTGPATHQITGASDQLGDQLYRDIRVRAGMRLAAPVIEGFATLPGSGNTARVLGVDPVAEAPFRSFASQDAGINLADFMAEEGAALISEETAASLNLSIGDTLALSIDGVAHNVRISDLAAADDSRSRQALENLLIVDIGTAQQLFDMAGSLTRIDLILEEDDTAGMARLRDLLPAGAEIVRSGSRTDSMAQMTSAFERNLQALSLLALLIGVFLIYNTMTFSVLQRRPLIGRLRASGVTGREIRTLILGEALLLGATGTAAGLLAGIILSGFLLQMVTQTINDLYFVLTVRQLQLDLFTLVKGLALGIGATLVAAIVPAREAAGAQVNTVLQRSGRDTWIRQAAGKLAAAGLSLFAAGGLVLLLPGQSVAAGYLGLLLMIAGFALLAPILVTFMAAGLRPVMARIGGMIAKMSVTGVVTDLSRTSVAVSALTIAVAATVGVGVMVDSFRGTVASWLEAQLRADIYVQPPGNAARQATASLKPELIRQLSGFEGVAGAHSVRNTTAQTPFGTVNLVAVEPGPSSRESYRMRFGRSIFDTDPDAANVSLPPVMVSEAFASRHSAGTGDTLRIRTDSGDQPFRISGVYVDFTSDLGVVSIDRTIYNRFFEDDAVSGLALYTSDEVDPEQLVQDLRVMAADIQEVYIRSNRGLREASLDIFDRTFTITWVLRLLAILVAFVGVLTALMALQLERSKEFAVLRANGMTPSQLWRYVTTQTGVMGAMAGLLSVPVGLLMATVLVHIINLRSFGWTLEMNIAPEILLQAVLLAFLAALLAGIYPSFKMSRANPADALKNE
ncbi:ABC transporter permease [Balneolales bacterium ANBcel1]|nr:ABC transporter permease [Balneolales bacterium ANBcel1]